MCDVTQSYVWHGLFVCVTSTCTWIMYIHTIPVHMDVRLCHMCVNVHLHTYESCHISTHKPCTSIHVRVDVHHPCTCGCTFVVWYTCTHKPFTCGWCTSTASMHIWMYTIHSHVHVHPHINHVHVDSVHAHHPCTCGCTPSIHVHTIHTQTLYIHPCTCGCRVVCGCTPSMYKWMYVCVWMYTFHVHPYTNESWSVLYKGVWVTSHIGMSHVTHKNESCHT